MDEEVPTDFCKKRGTGHTALSVPTAHKPEIFRQYKEYWRLRAIL
jgi:hypothetical protein